MGLVEVGTAAGGKAAAAAAWFSSTFSWETKEGSGIESEGLVAPGVTFWGLGITGLLCWCCCCSKNLCVDCNTSALCFALRVSKRKRERDVSHKLGCAKVFTNLSLHQNHISFCNWKWNRVSCTLRTTNQTENNARCKKSTNNEKQSMILWVEGTQREKKHEKAPY